LLHADDVRNFPARMALRDELQNLALARAEPIQ
jgi:hypothetical protein